MKRNTLALLAALTLGVFISCAKTAPATGGNKGNQDKTQMNYDLPEGQETIRILFIGNSFTLDATDHLPGILNAA